MNKIFKCYCNNDFDEINFEKHFKKCKPFINKFEEFDKKITYLLQNYSEKKEDLINVKFLLKQFIKLINSKLVDNNNNKNTIEKTNSSINSNKTSHIYLFKGETPNNEIRNLLIDNDNDLSYVCQILNSLAYLECIKNWYNNNNSIMNFSSTSLTKYFFQILSNLYNNKKYNIEKIIDKLNKSYESLFNSKFNFNSKDFLSFFLELLHYENNIDINERYISEIKNAEINKKIEDLYNKFENNLKQTQNSIISKNFFNIISYKVFCEECNSSFFYLNIEKIFSFDVDQLPPQEGKNYNLNNFFEYYSKKYPIKCKNCNNFKAFENKKILYNSEILIIYFKRTSHNDRCDIDFPDKFTINNNSIYPKSKNEFYFNPNYNLKACISYNAKEKYFSYINLNKNWYRYIDYHSKINHKFVSNPKDIHEFEPQILIYELDKYNMTIKINNGTQQKMQKEGLEVFNYIRKQYLEAQKVQLIFNLIPENEYKCYEVNLYDKFVNIIEKFLIKNKIAKNIYKLFIYNGMKIDINSKKTLKEIIFPFPNKPIDMSNLMIFAIKEI